MLVICNGVYGTAIFTWPFQVGDCIIRTSLRTLAALLTFRGVNMGEVSTMYADENVIRIKHDVLHEVAKLAFAGELDSKRDHIAVELIPGPTPQFRCCIYKEREIIRQSVHATRS
mgnify:CR=1 FL=1